MEALAHELGVGTKLDDLFAAVGYGKVSMRQVLARLLPAGAAGDAARRPTARARSPTPSSGSCASARSASRCKGTDDLLIYRAKCCNPIMGEPIVGYITRGKGVSVHAPDLPQRREPDVRPRAPHRRGVGARRGRRRLRGAHLGRGRGPPGPAGRHHRRARRHEHGHPHRGGEAPSTTAPPPSSSPLRIQDLKHLEKRREGDPRRERGDRRSSARPSRR